MKNHQLITVCSIGVVILATLAISSITPVYVDDTVVQTQEQAVSTRNFAISPLIFTAATSSPLGASTQPAEEFDQDNDVIPIYDSLPLSAELQEYTYNRCADYDIVEHYELVLAVMWNESRFRPEMISDTQDHGIMQINQINHARMREEHGITDFLDAEQNILCGISILAPYLHKYDNLHQALMCYGLGETGAQRAWQRGTYSTTASRNVVRYLELVKLNQYDSNS